MPGGLQCMADSDLKSRCIYTNPSYDERKRLHRKWHNIVEKHSQGHFTFEEDKLVSLSGVIQRFSQAFKDENLAGLWKRSMQYDLDWVTDWLSTYRHPMNPRPASYLAPTWSWASISGAATYIMTIKDENAWFLYTILNCEVFTRGPNKTGPLTGGYLKINCLLLGPFIIYDNNWWTDIDGQATFDCKAPMWDIADVP